MVVQQKLNDLKGRPHDEKKAVAGGIAVFVVVILVIAWGFLFLRRMQNTSLPSLENGSIPADQFNLNLIRGSERDQAVYDPEADIRALRDDAVQDDTVIQAGYEQSSSYGEDQFGAGSGGF